MNGKPVTSEEVTKIRELRQTGHSLPEIKSIVKRGSGTIFRYISGVEILPQYKSSWAIKRGGSKKRSQERWKKYEESINKIFFSTLTEKDLLLIASCLYWGEGTKKDFSFTNSDPLMIGTFIKCLEALNISKTRLRISIRIYEDIDRAEAAAFWARIIGIKKEDILSVNVLKGKKVGKLRHGMCRIRLTKGDDVFKTLQSAIKKITVMTGQTSS